MLRPLRLRNVQGASQGALADNDAPFQAPDYSDVLAEQQQQCCRGQDAAGGQAKGAENGHQHSHPVWQQQQLQPGCGHEGGKPDLNLPQLQPSLDSSFAAGGPQHRHSLHQPSQCREQQGGVQVEQDARHATQQKHQQEEGDTVRTSAASSCIGGSGVFFTELRRSYAGAPAPEEDAMSTRCVRACVRVCLCQGVV